jgi:hypothetical protein
MKQDTIHDAALQKDQTAAKKANQERWSRIKNEYEQRDCNRRNAGEMTGVTAAMRMHVAWENGSMEAQRLDQTDQDQTDQDQTDQDKTENVARTPYSSQEQDKTEAVVTTPHASQEQDKTEETMMPKKAQHLDQTDQRQQEQDMEFTK